MCGFVGGSDPSWDYDGAQASIFHRGPDAGAVVRGTPFSVAFRRLSIIDLRETANQPMFADDGETWIAFNGEIYRFKELRQQLERLGQNFRTMSDTEVVLRSYLTWGDGFLDRVDGIFAIVIWDAKARKLKLYRDRPGVKPLYYYWDGHRFGFASELKAIKVACRGHGLHSDETALLDFLTYRYIPAPKTPYRECFKLPPAHSLEFDPDNGTLGEPQRYWHVPIPSQPEPISVDDAADELRHLVRTCVADQMVADVPVGFFLSGGVDSSVVVAAASELGRKLSTFSIGFDKAEHSETPFARQVAETFGTDHTERIMTREHARDLVPKLEEWYDEPFLDESSFPTYFVSATAREKVTVVLTGDGGDEVFGGYRTYLRFARYSKLPAWPKFMDSVAHWLRSKCKTRGPQRALMQIEWAFSNDVDLWAKLMRGMSAAESRSYSRELGIAKDYDHIWHFRRHWQKDAPLRTRLQLVDFHTYLPDEVLTKVDRTSMAVSLEARVPLLDRRIIEFSFGLPEDVRFHGGLKGILRYAYRGILSPDVLDRKKKGFGTPRYYFGDVGTPGMQRRLLLPFMQAAGRGASSEWSA